MMAGPPGNYNNTTISVEPDNIYYQATTVIPDCINTIQNSVLKIANAWRGLQLGWVGTTADQVEDFANRWQASIHQLFGTPAQEGSGASTGILPKIAGAVGLVGANFGNAEHAVVDMFNQISTGGAGGSSSGSGRTTHTGAIWEDNTPKSGGN
jgi:hypothetical protein